MGTVLLLGIGSCGSLLGHSLLRIAYIGYSLEHPYLLFCFEIRLSIVIFFLFYVLRPAHCKFPLKVASYVVSLLIHFHETSCLDEYLFSQPFLSPFIAHSTTGQ